MAAPVLAQFKQWNLYNSSLLVEVTRPSGVFTCTGVAVSPWLLLTAAHCLEGEISKVRVFTQESYDPTQDFLEIANFKLHPHYNHQNSNCRSDIAKILMKRKLPSDIRIHDIHTGTSVKGQIYRFGFGTRNQRNTRTVVTPKLRRLNLADQMLELDDHFSRSGDSGGPIFIQDGQKVSLLAIHSTFSHGPEGEFSLNPRVSAYLSWIFEN